MQLDLSRAGLAALKSEAKTLRATAPELTHAQALEQIAKRHGARDWNTLHARIARPVRLTPGMRVAGHYLGHAFEGFVKAVELIGSGGDKLRVTLHFDDPVDVVQFQSFSSYRQRVTAVVGTDGRSVERTSDGTPHMVLETAR